MWKFFTNDDGKNVDALSKYIQAACPQRVVWGIKQAQFATQPSRAAEAAAQYVEAPPGL
jgi:hypothetical protein